MSTNPDENRRKIKDGEGLLLAGITLIGLGLGLAFNVMPAGLFLGLGLGILAMVIWRNRTEISSR